MLIEGARNEKANNKFINASHYFELSNPRWYTKKEEVLRLSNLKAEKSSITWSQIDGKCRPHKELDNEEMCFGDNHVMP